MALIQKYIIIFKMFSLDRCMNLFVSLMLDNTVKKDN